MAIFLEKKPANYFHFGSQLGITGYNWKLSTLKNKVVIQVSQDEYKTTDLGRYLTSISY